MTPQLLLPPEIAAAQAPAWAVVAGVLYAVLFAAGFTFVVLPV